MEQEEDDFDDEEEEEESENEEEDGEEVGEEENGEWQNDYKDAEMEELEYILKKDLLKGQAVKNHKALWDIALEFRFLLQKAFSIHMESWITTGKSGRSKMSQSSKNIHGDEDWSQISELLSRSLRVKTLQRESFNILQSDAAAQADGDPELLNDSEFNQQLPKEFFETIDPATYETSFYSLKKLHAKKRKILDRRACNSRKIRYNV